MNMSNYLRLLTPSLGGQVKEITGREPGLSRVHRVERAVEVAALIADLKSTVTHQRFSAVLGLAEYYDHARAVGGLLRSVQDEMRLIRLAAIYGIGWVGPRLTDAKLLSHAIKVLGCTLRDPNNIVIRWVAVHTLASNRAWGTSAVGRALGAEIFASIGKERELTLRDAALAALHRIGTEDALLMIASCTAGDTRSE